MKPKFREIKKVHINGIDQYISIEGNDKSKPVLFYLHGGPGSPMMYIFRKYHHELYNHFLIVQWEQRGSGKTVSKNTSYNTLKINQFVDDLYEIIKIITKKYDKKKIYLLAHSWGTIIGISAINRYPDLFHAYIGISQLINMVENEKKTYEKTLKKAKDGKIKKAQKTIEKIGIPFKNMKKPCTSTYKYGDKAKINLYLWKYKLGGIYYKANYFTNKKMFYKYSLIQNFLNNLPGYYTEYSFFDIIKRNIGSIQSMKYLSEEMLNFNVEEFSYNYEIPIYFIMGKYDLNSSLDIAKEYIKKINAPIKELIIFEESAHVPNIEEPNRLNKILIEKILPETVKK